MKFFYQGASIRIREINVIIKSSTEYFSLSDFAWIFKGLLLLDNRKLEILLFRRYFKTKGEAMIKWEEAVRIHKDV